MNMICKYLSDSTGAMALCWRQGKDWDVMDAQNDRVNGVEFEVRVLWIAI